MLLARTFSDLQEGLWSVAIFVIGSFTKSMIEKWISIHTDNQNEEKLAEKLDMIDQKLSQMVKAQSYKSFGNESNSNDIDLIKGKHLSNRKPHINDDEPKQLPIVAATNKQDICKQLALLCKQRVDNKNMPTSSQNEALAHEGNVIDEQVFNKSTEISNIESFSQGLNVKDSKKDIKQSISLQSLSTDHSQKVAMKKMFPYDVTNGKFKPSDVKECKEINCNLKFYEFFHKNSYLFILLLVNSCLLIYMAMMIYTTI